MRDSGRGLDGVLLDRSPAMRSCRALPFDSRSVSGRASIGVCGPLRDTERLESVVLDGDAGGGMAIALGMRARGVLLRDWRVLEGVVDGMPIPIPVGLGMPNAFGVLNGEPVRLRVGEDNCLEACTGEPNPVDLVGLADPAPRAGLPVDVLEVSCFAVIPTYFEARDPGVIFVWTVVVRPGVTSARAVVAEGRGRAEGVGIPGVRRPVEAAGVTRPLPIEGVTLPFPSEGVTRPLDTEGVLRPLAIDERAEGVILPDAEKEGVIRPLRVDATDEGREIPTVGADNLVEATKTPQFGGQVKYCRLHWESVSKYTA